MIAFLSLFLHILFSPFKTQARLEAEISVLRHQLNILRRKVPSKPRLTVADRLTFVWLYRLFPSVLNAITIIQPETVIRWHRASCHVPEIDHADTFYSDTLNKKGLGFTSCLRDACSRRNGVSVRAAKIEIRK
jgi:hypothetical protein